MGLQIRTKRIVKRLNEFVKEANFKYVYTIIKKEGKLFFVAGNNADCETERGTYYFLEYSEADKIFYEAFNKSEPMYKSVSDRWGDFRTAIIPQTSPGGTKYLLCADYDISYVNGLLRDNLIKSVSVAAFFLLLGFPIVIFYTKMRYRYFTRLQESESKYRDITEMVRIEMEHMQSQKEIITSILNAAMRAGDLTQNLLSFSRKGQLVLQAFDMHDCIKSALYLLERSIDKRITIEKNERQKISSKGRCNSDAELLLEYRFECT